MYRLFEAYPLIIIEIIDNGERRHVVDRPSIFHRIG